MWVWSGALLAVLFALADADSGEKRVVCYYTNWSVYRPGTAKFNPQNINPYLCTHLIYAFGGLTRENGIRAYDKYQDIEQGGYAKFTGLKTYNKQLKTLLAIGGWNEGSTRFSPMVADPERRAEFVRNSVRFLRTNHFDGLDLDWEYPAFRDGGKSADRDNYAALVQELREEFDKESKKTGRPRLLLTMAVPAGIEYIDKGYDVPRLNKYLDWMNILSYDYHSAFEPAVNHHSPLYPIGEDDEYNFDAQLSIDYTIKHYVKLGASRDKLVLGIPTYGRSYTLFNPDSSALGAPSDGPGEQGDATREKGYLAYYEICESNGWQVEKPHPRAMGPYAVKGNQWVGYDDTDIVRLKSQYVNEQGLGGIMFWSIDNDDFRGKCHGRPYPLIEAAKEALFGAKPGTDKNLVSSKSGKGVATRPKGGVYSSDSGNSDSNSSGTRRTNKLKTKATQRRTTVAATSSTSTTTSNPLTTPEPPSTPDPGSDFVCKDEGFFSHPRDCKKYFWCLDSGPSNLGIVAHQFTCPSGLFFNKAADSCDYARNVICTKKAAAPASTTAAPSTTPHTTGRASTTSTTTTTTTTTEAPVEEEEDDDDDEEEEGGQEDPEALKELLNLIKKLGGVEELEKQLRGGSSSNTESQATQPNVNQRNRSLVERVLQGRNRVVNGNAPPSSVSATTPKYKSLFRNGPSRPQNDGIEKDKDANSQRERPKYVSIRRERPTVAAELEEAVQNEREPEESAVEARTRSRYDKREEDQGTDVDEERRNRPATPEYITLRRNRPSEEPDVTTSRYVTLQRSRHSTTTEADVSRDEDDDDDEVIEDDEEESSVAIVTPSPSTVAPYREGPVYRPTPLRTRPPHEEEEVTTEAPSTRSKVSSAERGSSERVSLRRPGGFYNNSRGRRPTTTTSTTTTTTAAPRRTPARLVRRRKPATPAPVTQDPDDSAQAPTRAEATSRGTTTNTRRRKFRPDVRTTTPRSRDVRDEEVAAATQVPEVTTDRGQRYSFPRRRPTTSARTSLTPESERAATPAPEQTVAPLPEASPIPLQGRELNELLARALQEEQEHQERQEKQEQEADLTDLTHPAVVAIHTLATQAAAAPPAPTPSPFVASPLVQASVVPHSASFAHVRTGGAAFTPVVIPGVATNPPPSAPPRLRQDAARQEGRDTTPLPLLEIRVPVTRSRGVARRLPHNPNEDVPRLRTVSNTRTTAAPQLDYEYYDDDVEVSPSATKVKIHGDGWIECLDRGNFPHPFSCRKFISCAKMESGDLQGWEYTCPRGLSFDPIGGICNWSAGLGCKA